MRKILLSMTVVALFLGATALPAKAATNDSGIEVLLDAKKIQFPDAKPFQDGQGSVMVPIRFVSEALGGKVKWSKNNGNMAVEVKNGDHTVNMTVGQVMATVNGKTKSYGSKIVLKQNRTFVPLRLVSEGLGQKVEWDKVARWVWIGKKDALTLVESGLNPVSLTPYKKWFEKKPYLLKNMDEKPYEKVVIFKNSDLPTTFVRDIYSMELYTDKTTTATYLKVRAKTTSGSGNIFYLTNKTDIRYRNPMDSMTINNGDGTKYCFYMIWSPADKTLHDIVDQKPLTIRDIEYIGFSYGSKEFIPLMINPWKGN